MKRHGYKFAIHFFLFFVFMPRTSESQTFLWPTDASRVLTSTFAEYRPGHFHAGIDMSTWGKTGFPILAVGDGYVSRLGVSPYGYGRVLYLKLDSGETVVYGHLLKFNSKIEEIVKAQQRRTGRYKIQKYFDNNTLRYKAGDLLGFTGQTGIGVPHLHFEIRDEANRPINPLLKGYKFADSKVPIIAGVSFTPLDGFSMVNGDYKPIIMRPKVKVQGKYFLPEPVVISGNIGLGVSSYDLANGAANRFGVYEIELFVNNTVIFKSRYDRFSYDVTRHLVLDRDFRLQIRGYGKFYKLYREVGNKVEFYSCSQPLCGGVSYISNEVRSQIGKYYSLTMLPEGAHPFIIKLKDFYGNVSTVEGTLIVSIVPNVEILLAESSTNEEKIGTVCPINGGSLSRADVDVSRDRGRTWYPIADLTHIAGGGSDLNTDSSLLESSFTFPIRIPDSMTTPTLLRVTAQNIMGVQSHPFYSVLHPQDSWNYEELRFELEKDFYDNYVRLDIKASVPVEGTPVIYYWDADGRSKKAPVHQVDLQRFISTLPLDPRQSGTVSFEISAKDLYGRQSFQKEAIHLTAVPVGSKKRVRSDDGKCLVEFTPGSLFRDIFLRINSEPPRGANRFDVASRSYIIEPKDVPLKSGAWIRIKYDPAVPDPSKLGIYYWTETKGWRFLDNRRDNAISAFTGKVKSFGIYGLVRDASPPQILQLWPASGSRTSLRTPMLKAKFHDSLSGISGEDNMVLRIDGVRVIAEYDPERLVLFQKLERPLSVGKHEVSLFVRDHCGNVAERTHTFWVE